MSEWDEVLFCRQCKTREVFNVNGSGTLAQCFHCNGTIEGTSNIGRMRKLAVAHYGTELFQKQMDIMFKKLDEIATWKGAVEKESKK